MSVSALWQDQIGTEGRAFSDLLYNHFSYGFFFGGGSFKSLDTLSQSSPQLVDTPFSFRLSFSYLSLISVAVSKGRLSYCFSLMMLLRLTAKKCLLQKKRK